MPDMRRSGTFYVLYVLAALFALQGGGRCLRLLEVRIPPHVLLHGDARLECDFSLEGETLYSVKWYKDGREFYRYVPRDKPQRYVFPLSGVSVDVDNSSESVVVLRGAELQTTGRYRCEVSAEAPSFDTVSEHGDMLVVVLPEGGPRITGGRPRYHVGEMVDLNCTSAKSFPAAQLSWFVNGEQANESLVYGRETTTDEEDLVTSVLGLRFRAEEQHFRGGDLKLKCLASVSTVYWRSNEESAQPHAHLLQVQRARAMQSRATPAPQPSPAHDDAAGSQGESVHGNTKYGEQGKESTGSVREEHQYPWSSQLNFSDTFNVTRSAASNVITLRPVQPPEDSDNSEDVLQPPLLSTPALQRPPPMPSQNVAPCMSMPPTGPSCDEILQLIRDTRKHLQDNIDKVLEYLSSKMKKEHDGTDLLFLSYADTFKKFSSSDQTLLKIQLAKLFANAELKLHQNTDNPQVQFAPILSPVYSNTSSVDGINYQKTNTPQNQPLNLTWDESNVPVEMKVQNEINSNSLEARGETSQEN